MADTEHMDEDKRCTLFDKPQRFCQRCSEFHTADEWMASCERYIGASPIRKCTTCGGWHPLDRWNPNCMPERNWNESDLPVCRTFISDNLEALGGLNGLQSMVSGQFYTSKSELRREYRRAGVEEVGSEASRTPPAERVSTPEINDKALERDVAMTVKRTLEELKSDNFSNDQMANMLRSPAPDGGLGLAIA